MKDMIVEKQTIIFLTILAPGNKGSVFGKLGRTVVKVCSLFLLFPSLLSGLFGQLVKKKKHLESEVSKMYNFPVASIGSIEEAPEV